MSGAAEAAQAAPSDDEHAELRKQYSATWAEEDAASTARWKAFLEAKAGRPVTNDAEAAALVREVLPPLLPSRPRATVGEQELDALVLGGVPSALRGAIWPVLLRAGAGFAPGYYQQLVQVVEGGWVLGTTRVVLPLWPDNPVSLLLSVDVQMPAACFPCMTHMTMSISPRLAMPPAIRS